MTSLTTIPKQLSQKGELVVLPKVDYEKMIRIIQKKKLDSDLVKAIKEYETGRFYGPFASAQEGVRFLKSRR